MPLSAPSALIASRSQRLATAASLLIDDADRLTEADVIAVWQAARRQLDRWHFILSSALEAASTSGPLKPNAAVDVAANIEAVLTAEPLLRSWVAIICEVDRRTPDAVLRPLALNVYELMLSARLDALRLLTHVEALPNADAGRLDTLRRRRERRTDWLLAALGPEYETEPFGFSPSRIRDFAIDTVRIGGDQAIASLAAAPLRTDEAVAPELPTSLAEPFDAMLSRIGV